MSSGNDLAGCYKACAADVTCTRFYVCSHHSVCGTCTDASTKHVDGNCTTYRMKATKRTNLDLFEAHYQLALQKAGGKLEEDNNCDTGRCEYQGYWFPALG